MAFPYGKATNSSCPLCHQPDSQTNMLFGCQNASIQNMDKTYFSQICAHINILLPCNEILRMCLNIAGIRADTRCGTYRIRAEGEGVKEC